MEENKVDQPVNSFENTVENEDQNIENNTKQDVKSFEDLNLKENLLRGIYSYGFEKPSRIQSLGIPMVVKGKDLIAQSQSGTGKTGSFTIGILNQLDEDVKKSQYIVISPTHELANQIYNVFEELSKYNLFQD